MKQQFFVGDVVKVVDVHELVEGAVWTSTMDDCHGRTGTVVDIVTYTNGYIGYVVNVGFEHYNFAPEWLTIVERKWQKNTGKQPVEDGVEIEIKYRDGETFRSDVVDCGWGLYGGHSDIMEWRIADSVTAVVEDTFGFGAAADKIVADVPTNQEWTDKHYDNNYTLTQKDIERGFVKIDPYFVSKMWKIGSKDDSGALWHCKNKYSREVKPNVFIDVYDVLRAFEVTDPCLSHLAKKALCAGLRGHKNRLEDLNDIKASIERAIEMHLEWSENGRV